MGARGRGRRLAQTQVHMYLLPCITAQGSNTHTYSVFKGNAIATSVMNICLGEALFVYFSVSQAEKKMP